MDKQNLELYLGLAIVLLRKGRLHKTDPTFIPKVIAKANDLPAFWRERYKQTLTENSALKSKIIYLEKKVFTETVEKNVVQDRSKLKLNDAELSDGEDAVESTLLQLSGAEDPEYLSFLLSLFFTQISQKLSYEQCKSLTETILGKLHTFWDSTQVSDLEILAAGLQPRSVFVYFLNWFYQVLHDLNGYESAELCIQTLIHLGETQPVVSIYIISHFLLERGRHRSVCAEPLSIAIYQKSRFNEFCFCLYQVLNTLLHRCTNNQGKNDIDDIIFKNVKLKLSEFVVSNIDDSRVANAFRSLKW
ncbi:Hypothetical protein, no similarity [Geotrichum candidum]|uniref:Uncharacterized protein n=1 Tax=Geotrichum candidum TaxID=1173061 RepID=A0A0J9XJK4_GEOCN|nr:Hypothetical protein, no similarity [Geotrichum candidum]